MRGISPPKSTPGIGEEGEYSPPCPYVVYATILNRGETRPTTAVVFRGRLRQTKQEVGIAVRASFSVFEGVIYCGEELEPSLDSGDVVPHFAYASQSLVV